MSTNLSPEAKLAEQDYANANTLEEKIVKLEKYISMIPKHKATEKMVATLRSRLVRHKAEFEENRRRQKSLSKGPTWVIPKEGDAQVTLIGVVNSGKSQLLKMLTSANAKTGEYPFTTEKPDPGVLDCDGAIIQLIDTPSIFKNVRTESKNGAMLLSQIRAADLIAFVIDLTRNPLEQMTILIDELYNGSIRVNKELPPIELRKTGSGGAILIGEDKIDGTRADIIGILNEQGLYNFSLKTLKPMSLSDLVEALDYSISYNQGIIIANKGDQEMSKENFELLKKEYSKQFQIFPVSAINEDGFDVLKPAIFKCLNLVRIRSKEPNGGIAPKPIVMKEGATVGEVAKLIHTRFFDLFKQAKIYGPSAKFDGQSVGLNHVLKDGDVVEIFSD